MNPIEVYQDCGRKAGLAAKRKDMSQVTFHQSWCNRAIAMESEPYKSEAREAFRKAYRDEATPFNKTW